MFKDWDGHCYFDTCHYDTCFEETEWMEPQEEEIRKKKEKKLSATLCKKCHNREYKRTLPPAPMPVSPLWPYYQKALKYIRKESMAITIKKPVETIAMFQQALPKFNQEDQFPPLGTHSDKANKITHQWNILIQEP